MAATQLQPGADADIAIVDPTKRDTIRGAGLHSERSRFTPFEGMETVGMPVATIVRGADTDRLDIAPEAAGLLAISLGLSRMFSGDIEQLDAGMLVYDSLYRWARDATEETHNWPAAGGKAPK